MSPQFLILSFAAAILLAVLSGGMRQAAFLGANIVFAWMFLLGARGTLSKYNRDEPDKRPTGLAETIQAIETGYQLCQSQGVHLVILFVPTMIRVMEPYIDFDRPEDRAEYVPNGGVPTDKDFSGRIAELCKQIGCTFINGLPPLRQAASPDNRNLFIPIDEHLDVRGHEVLAQAIVNRLQSDNGPNEPKRNRQFGP